MGGESSGARAQRVNKVGGHCGTVPEEESSEEGANKRATAQWTAGECLEAVGARCRYKMHRDRAGRAVVEDYQSNRDNTHGVGTGLALDPDRAAA